jgi:hypothetical protein
VELVRLRFLLAVSVAIAVPAAGCAGAEAPPVLDDGSAARSPPVAFEGVGSAVVATRVRLVRTATSTRVRRCARQLGVPSAGIAVERVGVQGASLTIFDRDRHKVYGCDSVDGAWCGWAAGKRRSASGVDDPRLTLSCRSGDTPVGFAWVEPGPGAQYVVVEQSGFAESYPVAGHVPVRVTSTATDLESASARFRLREHARDGRLLSERTVETRVAG